MTARKADSDGPFIAKFKEIRQRLDDHNDRRERLVRASREVTQSSKKAIFKLHRLTPKNSDILESATKDLSKIRTVIAKQIASELDADSYPRFHRAFSPGLQEYIEARTFLHFLKDQDIISLNALENEIQQACRDESISFEMTVEQTDYVLGIADLTGELMRRAIGSATSSDTTAAFTIRRFLSDLEARMESLSKSTKSLGRDMPMKMKVLQQSRGKVEKACFDMVVRHSEFGAKSTAPCGQTLLPPAKRARLRE